MNELYAWTIDVAENVDFLAGFPVVMPNQVANRVPACFANSLPGLHPFYHVRSRREERERSTLQVFMKK